MLQIHPSLLCNFQCSHCYSSSSPKERNYLESSFVIETIRNANRLGYENLSISGGEPLLYPFLHEILITAKELNMVTSLITNGSFPKEKYISLVSLVDTIGVSIDGNITLHNEIRKNANSFQKLDALLGFLTASFPSVGIGFTLTDQSWEHLPNLIEYADSKGVNAFQIYPLEMDGRAHESRLTLSGDTLMRTYVLCQFLAAQYKIKVNFNCFSRNNLANYFQSQHRRADSDVMADALDLIVLNEQGELLPYTYGLDSRWSIANKEEPLTQSRWKIYQMNLLKPLNELCSNTCRVCLTNKWNFIRYHEILKKESEKPLATVNSKSETKCLK